jgi:signal peptidase
VLAGTDKLDRIGCELVAGSLRAGHEVRVRVAGSSMVPALWPGDELRVRALAPAESVGRAAVPAMGDAESVGRAAVPAMGDLLLFVRDGRLCTHRLVDRLDDAGGSRLITCGDAAIRCDPPIAASEILGTVASITRGGREIPIASSPPQRLLSLAIRHSGFIRRAALKIHSIRSRSWTLQQA